MLNPARFILCRDPSAVMSLIQEGAASTSASKSPWALPGPRSAGWGGGVSASLPSAMDSSALAKRTHAPAGLHWSDPSIQASREDCRVAGGRSQCDGDTNGADDLFVHVRVAGTAEHANGSASDFGVAAIRG